jgi:hypothetical protein
MSKIISNPFECGLRKPLKRYPLDRTSGHICKDGKVCALPHKFPTNCPLQDGIKRYETFKEVLKVAKKICLEETGMSLIDRLTLTKPGTLKVVVINSQSDLPPKGTYFCNRNGFLTIQTLDNTLPTKSHQREIRWYISPAVEDWIYKVRTKNEK